MINATLANCSLGLRGGRSPRKAVLAATVGIKAGGGVKACGGGSGADERDHRDSAAVAAVAFVIGPWR